MITVLMDEVELIIDSMDPAEREVMTVVGRIVDPPTRTSQDRQSGRS
ncbi:hypothetical protein [Methanothermobacter marburgensis]